MVGRHSRQIQEPEWSEGQRYPGLISLLLCARPYLMAKPSKTNFFWPSYTDLMTSLFFIMLVLYVLSYTALRAQQQATQEQVDAINKIQNALQQLDTTYFVSQPEFKRFVLRRQIQFAAGKSIIPIPDYPYLLNVGRKVGALIDTLQKNFADQNIKYLLIIEGMASKDNYPDNYGLSYDRALALKTLWENMNIKFDPTVCEIQIAGSGTEGLGRHIGVANEYKNQRLILQIVPKIDKIE